MASEWKEEVLEDCMAAIIDYRGKTPTKTSSGIPLITAKVVKGGRIEKPDEFIAETDYEAWMRRGIPEAGDVVITTEAPLGQVAQLGNERVALAQRLIALRGKQGVLDNTFLKFLMQSRGVQDQLLARASGTTVFGIRQSELRKIILTLPPFSEQRAIADILGSLDDKIEVSRQMNETLEVMTRELFRSWFVDFEPSRAKREGRATNLPQRLAELFPGAIVSSQNTEIPESWQLKPIGELAVVSGGSTPSTKELSYWENGTHYWATPKDLSTLTTPVLLETERKITDSGLAQISSGLLPKGTVLMSSRAPIGYLAVAEVPVAINQGFIAMKPSVGISNLFLLRWAEWAHELIVSQANGSTFLEISKSSFRPILVATPSDAVMKRLGIVAKDLVRHFEERLEAMDGKAMVVCMSRRICVDLYNEIVKLRPDWHNENDDAGVLKIVMTGSATDGAEWQQHIRDKRRREALGKRFKDAIDPFKVVIVRDMWLTGFDVPSLHTMYVDKPMRGHGLMQAIARVNRVFKDKPGGLVVDYLGIAHELKLALATYTESGGKGRTALPQEEAVAVMLEKYEVCLGLFHGFNWSAWITGTPAQKLGLLPNAQEHILKQKDGKDRLVKAVTDLSKAFALSVPHDDAIRIRDDVGFFQAVRTVLTKSVIQQQRPEQELDNAIRQIVSRLDVKFERQFERWIQGTFPNARTFSSNFRSGMFYEVREIRNEAKRMYRVWRITSDGALVQPRISFLRFS
jgi:restriction endonuclease S subunit